MSPTDLKGVLGARVVNLAEQLKQSRTRRILIESDLLAARLIEAETQGQLDASRQALSELDQPFGPPAEPAKPPQAP